MNTTPKVRIYKDNIQYDTMRFDTMQCNAWYPTVRYDALQKRCEMITFGMLAYNTKQHDAITSHDALRYRNLRYHTVQYENIAYNTLTCGKKKHHNIQNNLSFEMNFNWNQFPFLRGHFFPKQLTLSHLKNRLRTTMMYRQRPSVCCYSLWLSLGHLSLYEKKKNLHLQSWRI